MARRRRQGWASPPPGSDYTMSGGELTARGRERWDELAPRQYVVPKAKVQRYRVQDRALRGLTLLLIEVLVLGTLALGGVAARWFDSPFALEVLAITLTPSFGAWLIVVRWAFRRDKKT